ncbi:hypothetical protein Tco_0560881 [Tanacetum coccineum]
MKGGGGLGGPSLRSFNSALMVSHIWKLLSLKESLWVKWIHAYKLKGRSFWEVPLRGNMSWGWRKILQLRPIIREFHLAIKNGTGTKYLIELAGLVRVVHDVYAIIHHIGPKAKRISSHIVIAKLVVAASAYFIWQERNWRLFKKSKRTVNQVIECIKSAVRLKLLSCSFKRSSEGVRMLGCGICRILYLNVSL